MMYEPVDLRLLLCRRKYVLSLDAEDEDLNSATHDMVAQ
jgi:hypothetical protein